MQFALVAAALVGAVVAAPQASPTDLAPPSTASGCASTYNGGAVFQIGIVSAASPGKVKRQDPNTVPGNSLMLTLNGGQLKDQAGRIGYIASNDQLQFDNPIQSNAKYTTGFSACPNGTLALETAVWFECLSGKFYNLYDASQGAQCGPAYLQIVAEGGSVTPSTSVETGTIAITTTIKATSAPAATQATDGQPQGNTKSATVITSVAVISPSTTGTAIASQITDGQVQGPNSTASLTPFNPNSAPVSSTISGGFLAGLAGVVGIVALLL